MVESSWPSVGLLPCWTHHERARSQVQVSLALPACASPFLARLALLRHPSPPLLLFPFFSLLSSHAGWQTSLHGAACSRDLHAPSPGGLTRTRARPDLVYLAATDGGSPPRSVSSILFGFT